MNSRLLRGCSGIKRGCYSDAISEPNVTLNIWRSSDSSSTVLPRAIVGDWGSIVRDLETIIVLVLLTFHFILQRSHHSLTLPKSRYSNSATTNRMPGDETSNIYELWNIDPNWLKETGGSWWHHHGVTARKILNKINGMTWQCESN